MRTFKVTINARVWLYPGESAQWHFVTIPRKDSATITEKFKEFKRGWGSLPATATIGKTTWKTSIFPDSTSGTYLLPLKALVRRMEGIQSGDLVTATIAIQP